MIIRDRLRVLESAIECLRVMVERAKEYQGVGVLESSGEFLVVRESSGTCLGVLGSAEECWKVQ